MHIRKRTGKRVLNEIGKHDILFLLHFNLLSKQQPVCIIKVIFFTRIFSLRFWHSLFKWNFKCITTYRMQNALAMLRLRVCVCVCFCVFVFWFYRISRQIAPTMGTYNSLVLPVTSCFHLHLINTRSTKPTNFHRRQTWKIFSCFIADTISWQCARVIKVTLMTFKPCTARKRMETFIKSVRTIKMVADKR